MILIDTNVFAEFTRPSPSFEVVQWFARHRDVAAVSAIVLFEALSGAEMISDRNYRKHALALYRELFAQLAIPPFVVDDRTARFAGELSGRSRRAGVQLIGADAVIAATAALHRAPLATRNLRDFKATGLTLIDPWTAP